jgi:hypothetical protein
MTARLGCSGDVKEGFWNIYGRWVIGNGNMLTGIFDQKTICLMEIMKEKCAEGYLDFIMKVLVN